MFQQKFNVPDLKASTLAVDANRRIIVADSASRCIHVISLDTGELHKPDHVILLSGVPLDFNVSIDKRKIRNEKKYSCVALFQSFYYRVIYSYLAFVLLRTGQNKLYFCRVSHSAVMACCT